MTDSFVGAIALIRRFVDEQCFWLVRRESLPGEHGKLGLLQSERLEKESYRELIDREVGWILKLDRGRDYIVSSVPRAHFQGLVETIAGGTLFVMEFYVVDLFGGRAATRLDRDSANEWLSTAELFAEINTGSDLDPVQKRLLQLAEVIRPDGS